MNINIDLPTPRWSKPLFKPSRYKGLKGGRSSGKSHFVAERVVEELLINPNKSAVCIREVQRSLKHSAKRLIDAKISVMGVRSSFRTLESEIRRVGGNGIILFQGMQDHTADSIKSLEDFELAWGEEAHRLSQRSLDLLLPTIRAEGSEIWFTWNPELPTDPVDKLMRDEEAAGNAIVVHVNFLDNPFRTRTIENEAKRHKERDPHTYPHIWLGEYTDQTKNQLLNLFWINEARRRLTQEDGSFPKIRVSIDVSDGGECETVFTVGRHYVSGVDIVKVIRKRFPAATAVADAHEFGKRIFFAHGGKKESEDDFVVDGVGVGSGTAANLSKDGFNVIKHKGGAASDDPEKYRNRRTQVFIVCRNFFRDGNVSIMPDAIEKDDVEDFEKQLLSIKTRPGAEKVDEIESKVSLLSRGEISPDIADSVSMQFATRAEYVEEEAREAHTVENSVAAAASW